MRCTIGWLRTGAAGLLVTVASSVMAAEEPNYDESKVPDYTLPDPLVLADGRPVESAEQWNGRRRSEVLELLERHVYGRTPDKEIPVRFERIGEHDALDGKARCRQVRIQVGTPPNQLEWDVALWIPAQAPRPAPVFVGLNFGGNHTVHPDPRIRLPGSWVRNNSQQGITDHQASEASRGASRGRWPLDLIVRRGYALATLYYGDIDPDYDDQFQNGLHPLFYRTGQQRPEPDEWGSIGAWAWGLSRMVDYLETDSDVDAQRVALMGHSRLGKTSLWAGAQDARFGIVISNNSGCGGAALSRRRFGETVARINSSFPHWFCGNFHQYNDREDELPVDQHMLIALMAPRPVLVCSAQQDRWADPKGEFLAARHASPVYQLFGWQGIARDEPPGPLERVGQGVVYHLRPGPHDVTRIDWEAYLELADQHWR